MLNLFGGPDGMDATSRFLEESLGIGTFLYFLDDNRLMWSAGMYRLLGLEPGSVKPDPAIAYEMMHPDDRKVSDTFNRDIAVHLNAERQFRIILRDGRVRWVHRRSELLMGRDGRPERLIGVISDISDKKDLENRLEMAASRMDALARATGGRVWHARADGEIIDAPQADGTRDSQSRERLGRGWLNMVHPDDRDASVKAWETALARRETMQVEHRVRQPNGDYRWHASRAFPLKSASGDILEWVGCSIDIHRTIPVDGPEKNDQITGAQIRGARGMLNISLRDLAVSADVSVAVLRRLEDFDGQTGGSRGPTAAVKTALEKAGIEFLTFSHGQPGVRLKQK